MLPAPLPDTFGNYAPDGLVGPYREREASFATVREVWSPVGLAGWSPRGRSGQVEPVQVHDLVPGGHEVAHELLLRVVLGVHLGERPEDRVRSEHEVDPRARPLELARRPVAVNDGPQPATSDFALPELPVSINIGEISAASLVLGETVLGVPAELRLEGRGQLEGGTARLVLLPFEDHGYRARESIEHVLWEQIRWFDEHVKNAKGAAPAASPSTGHD